MSIGRYGWIDVVDVDIAMPLRESEERERAAQDRHRLERQRAREVGDSAAEHAVALAAARRIFF